MPGLETPKNIEVFQKELDKVSKLLGEVNEAVKAVKGSTNLTEQQKAEKLRAINKVIEEQIIKPLESWRGKVAGQTAKDLEEALKALRAKVERLEEPQSDPALQKEFTELSIVQDEKVETQKSDFKNLEDAKQKLAKEGDDILRIANEKSKTPEKFILEGVKEYAKKEGISLLAAKASVLQYVSPEWKEKVDAEVREYFANFDFSKFIRLPAGSEETETLKILCDEGYMPYFVVVTHFRKMGNNDVGMARNALGMFDGFKETMKNRREAVKDAEKTRTIFDKLPKEAKESEEGREIEKTLKDSEKALGGSKESFVLNNANIFPEAKKYVENIKKTATKEKYEYAINLMYEYLSLGQMTRQVFADFDCDETTLFLQKIALDEGLEIGNYMQTDGHVVLKLDGFPMVLDTYDIKIRSIEECAKQTGYEGTYGSNFWRDDKGEYLAQYEAPENYPSKITGYKKVEKNPITTRENFALAVLICDLRDQKHLRYIEETFGENWPVYEEVIKAGLVMNPTTNLIYYSLKEEERLIYKKALEIDPNFAEAHRGLAILLQEEDEGEARMHFKKAIEIDPNFTLAHMQFGFFLDSKGESEEGIKHLEKAIEIDPNDAKSRIGLISILLAQEKLKEARKELDKIDTDKVGDEWGKTKLKKLDKLLKKHGA